MEYVYAALLLHESEEEINEENVTAVLEAAGVSVEESRVKALVAALEDVDIEEALETAAAVPAGAGAPDAGAAAGEVEEAEGDEEEAEAEAEEAEGDEEEAEAEAEEAEGDEEEEEEDVSGEGLGDLFG